MENELIKVERELSDIKSDLAAVKEQCKTLFNQQAQQNKLTETVHSLAISMQKMVDEQNHMRADLTGVRSDVDEIKARPGKRWESVVEKVILTVVAALVGFALAQIGLK